MCDDQYSKGFKAKHRFASIRPWFSPCRVLWAKNTQLHIFIPFGVWTKSEPKMPNYTQPCTLLPHSSRVCGSNLSSANCLYGVLHVHHVSLWVSVIQSGFLQLPNTYIQVYALATLKLLLDVGIKWAGCPVMDWCSSPWCIPALCVVGCVICLSQYVPNSEWFVI